MSDSPQNSPQPPPTRPKPGSLRDRIAAFEKPVSLPSTPKPPPVRAKPGNWKPASSSSPPNANETADYEERDSRGGMSASDAKESIGKGGSLKERMAALQGKGAFGSGAAPGPPPIGQKPMKRHPLVVPPPPMEESKEHATELEAEKLDDQQGGSDQAPHSDSRYTDVAHNTATEDASKGEKGDLVEGEPDTEAKERERRAAIAARMARLGGARVGLAPPVFGKKPEPKEKPNMAPLQETYPSVPPDNTAPVEVHVSNPSAASDAPDGSDVHSKAGSPPEVNEAGSHIPVNVTAEESGAVPSPAPPSPSSPDPVLELTPIVDSEAHLNLDPASSESSHPSSHMPLRTMPIPAVPRRTGPPRKKSALNLKAKAKVDGQESFGGSVVPAEALVEPTEAPQLSSTTQHESSSLSAGEGAKRDPIIASKAINAPPSVGVTDGGELAQAVLQSPNKAINEAKHVNITVVDGEQQIEDPNISKPERGTHTSTVEASTTKDMQNIIEQHDSNEPELSRLLHSEMVLSGEQHVDIDSTMTLVEHSSEPTPEDEASPSTAVFLTDELTEEPPETETALVRTQGESDYQARAVTKEQTEDEEAERQRLIAERLAQMGGRNPFSSTPFGVVGPAKNISGDESHEVVDASSHEQTSVEEDKNKDAAPEGSALANTAAEAEIRDHEADGREPPVSIVEKEQRRGVATAESIVESEAIDSEHTLQLSQPGLEDYPETVPLNPEDISSSEDIDEMAPSRITRAIPSLPQAPPLQSLDPILHMQSIAPTFNETSSSTKDPVGAGDENDMTAQRSGSHEQSSIASSSISPVSIPLVNSALREDSEADSSPSPTVRRSMPPPPRTISINTSTPSTAIQSLSSASSRKLFSPPSRTVPASGHDYHPVEESSPPASPRRGVPSTPQPPVPQMTRSLSSDVSPTQSAKQRPTSIRRSVPPPPPIPSQKYEDMSPLRMPSQPIEAVIPPVMKPASSNDTSESSNTIVPALTATPDTQVIPRESFEEQEVLPESEPDPIDPAFCSPPRSPAASREQHRPSFNANSREASEDNGGEDVEQARRRTIAERMAKLGGIRFGAPPPIPRKSVPPPPDTSPVYESEEGREQDLDTEDNNPQSHTANEEAPDSKEVEHVRRQAIAARLAGLGGMRFGMLPQMPPPKQPLGGSPNNSARTAEKGTAPPHPSAYGPSPSSVEAAAVEADSESVSDEGVKVEAGSELSMEEVNPEDAEEEAEEIPPQVPSRRSRPSHPPPTDLPPPLPGGRRPPMPTSTFTRPPVPRTEAKHSSVSSSIRKASGSSGPHVPPSGDFVIVDDNQEIPPPRSRPSRPSLPPSVPSKDIDNSPWELPEIPRGSFDVNVPSGFDVDASISLEDSTTYPPAAPAPTFETIRPLAPAPAVRADVQVSADELLQLWGVVGTAVHAAASTLFDRSKKSVVGDGTSQGFVNAVLAQVPQASKASYGHLIYSQSGNSVLRRSSAIMPGDIIQLTEAKLKGHKGLQSYHQTAGTVQDPLFGIVSEFDGKKSKVKVLQANQHVGSQTVETTSYRLDDLKSGSVKVFRVASV